MRVDTKKITTKSTEASRKCNIVYCTLYGEHANVHQSHSQNDSGDLRGVARGDGELGCLYGKAGTSHLCDGSAHSSRCVVNGYGCLLNYYYLYTFYHHTINMVQLLVGVSPQVFSSSISLFYLPPLFHCPPFSLHNSFLSPNKTHNHAIF